uniref:Reverse transcriptase domain-containing protein n=1 Tax=Tanacetum cinerariifolium TaxID=118510 RepID=A0A6L2L3B9_TANCI|nr:reverse transcriptase domain-containing protein [Tanacetum cinerariifolium]
MENAMEIADGYIQRDKFNFFVGDPDLLHIPGEKKKQQFQYQDHELTKLKNFNDQRLSTDSSENRSVWMHPRSSSKLARDQTSNPTSSTNPTPKGRIRRSSKEKVDNSHFEEHLTPVDTMTDNRTMAEMLRAPTKGCAEAIVVLPILAEKFELKHRVARQWIEKEPPRSITTWDDLVSKFINEFFPPSRTRSLRNEILNFQQKFDESFHEAWERYKDLLRACPRHGFTELTNATKI